MASTTIVPFSTLPACATNCYHLYDANGACVPPAVATGSVLQYGECFCSNAYLTPFSTGTAGVCDQACTQATETSDLASIRNWYTSFCAANEAAATGTGTTTSATSTSTSKSSKSSGSNSWLTNHWQWVVFIVVVVVGIIAVWIGACLWHRRYLRKKDRQYALRHMRASTGAQSGTAGLGSPSQHNIHHHNSVHGSVILANTGGAAGIPGPNVGGTPAGTPGTPAVSTPNVAPGTAVTYDENTEKEKRRSNVLIGRRRN